MAKTMRHVSSKANGMLWVEMKVPDRLRAFVGATNLRRSLESTVLNAATERRAFATIAEFQKRIKEAEQKLSEEEVKRKAAQDQQEVESLLEFVGVRKDTPTAEIIELAASAPAWLAPEYGQALMSEAVKRVRNAPPLSKEAVQMEAFSTVLALQHDMVRQINSKAGQKQSAATAKPLEGTVTLSALLERYAKSDSPKPDTLRQYKDAVRVFQENHGDMAVIDIDRRVVGDFRDYLHGREDLTFGTCGQRMKKLTALFNFAIRYGLYEKMNPFSKMHVSEKAKEGHGNPNAREGLSDDVVNIYQQDIPPRFSFSDSMRWPILVMQQTGMRIEEACGLRVDEVVVHWNVSCFHIKPRQADNRSVKGGNKARYCPISDHLWNTLGFSKYVAMRKKEGAEMLFDFSMRRGSRYSDLFAERMKKIRDDIKEERGVELGDNHEFRHTLNTLLTEAGVTDKVRCLIAGQATGSRVNAGYGDRNAGLQHLLNALNSINLSRYDYSKLIADIPTS